MSECTHEGVPPHTTCGHCWTWLECGNDKCDHPACAGARCHRWVAAYEKQHPDAREDVLVEAGKPTMLRRRFDLVPSERKRGEEKKPHLRWLKALIRARETGDGWISLYDAKIPTDDHSAATVLLEEAGVKTRVREARFQSRAMIAYAEHLGEPVCGGLIVMQYRLGDVRAATNLLQNDLASDTVVSRKQSTAARVGRSSSSATKGGRAKVATAQETKPAASTKTARKAKGKVKRLPVGANVPLYLKDRGYKAQERNRLIREAEELAKGREARVVRLEYVMLAEGEITEKQLGSEKVEALRKSLQRKRLRKPTAKASNGTSRRAAPPRPRQQRQKAATK